MKKNKSPKDGLPRGVTEKEIRDLIDYYDNQSDDEQVAEIEAAYEARGQTRLSVPTNLVPTIEALVARAEGKVNRRGKRARSMV